MNGGVSSALLGQSSRPVFELDFTADYWFLVAFNGVDRTPRQRLASVGHAFMASGLVPGTEVSGPITSGTYAAVKGVNTATAGIVDGLCGQSDPEWGRGIFGFASATTGLTFGVMGQSTLTAGAAVYGLAAVVSGSTGGVYGASQSTGGSGFRGSAGVPPPLHTSRDRPSGTFPQPVFPQCPSVRCSVVGTALSLSPPRNRFRGPSPSRSSGPRGGARALKGLPHRTPRSTHFVS